jgi:hypothetical protein
MLQWQSGQITAVRGSVQLHDLQQLQPRIEFGSYELLLDDTALRQDRIVGTVHDTSAPLRLAGELQFTLRGAYEFNGSVAPNGTTSAELQQVLDSLGNPDAQGNRTVSVAGSL